MNIKYFLPDWEDRLDPKFNFKTDCFSPEHKKNPTANDVHAHDLLTPPPYDGVLFSLANFIKKSSSLDLKNPKIRGYTDIKKYLKLNGTLQVMGDCGAFSYINEDIPPEPFFSIENVANFYNKLNFDYGVSVDHIVTDAIQKIVNGEKVKIILSKKDKEKRIKITLNNAKKFLKYHRKQKFDFKPIGVAQGLNPKSYKKSVEKLIDYGYEYIALGGLVQKETSEILAILDEIQSKTKNVDIHLFGISRPEAMREFKEFGVTSFDSASYFRKAFLESNKNYFTKSGKWYSAIRVPYSDNKILNENAKKCGYSQNDLEKMEKIAMKSLIKYDQGKLPLEETLNSLINYDKILLRRQEKIETIQERYRATLEDKPWKKCDCDICGQLGIHVIIFRGTNRNKRRGFHNVWTFNRYFNGFHEKE
ncbi:MAG: hypothetical protein M0R30_05295 [Methanoregula sp.]|jgi:hypothetical protein|uniref:tRNA-guanine transglycosylase DpdA n=1 Tax=Methanoregula sp. TaxID=2052170 RepID=UPI0025F8764B|nr:tRNA-guanine transglycosylase DpdA [Methanoregula sp.]MCK9631039.1 hypothetical protein [Methanoregula sp.]